MAWRHATKFHIRIRNGCQYTTLQTPSTKYYMSWAIRRSKNQILCLTRSGTRSPRPRGRIADRPQYHNVTVKRYPRVHNCPPLQKRLVNRQQDGRQVACCVRVVFVMAVLAAQIHQVLRQCLPSGAPSMFVMFEMVLGMHIYGVCNRFIISCGKTVASDKEGQTDDAEISRFGVDLHKNRQLI